MRLRGRLLPTSELTDVDRRAMLALMDRHYAGFCSHRFATDLAEKDWVVALYDRGGELRGFSTQKVLSRQFEGQTVRALFSGDTIVDREHWGDPALSHVWGRLALEMIDAVGDAELYWFLISQGFRTYRFLPVFFHEFYPCHDQIPPTRIQRLLNALAVERFGDALDPSRGIVRASCDQYRLRDSLAAVPSAKRRDPHVEFFLRANPNCAYGDELCCLAPLTRENFTPAAWRVIHAGTPPQLSPQVGGTIECQLPLG